MNTVDKAERPTLWDVAAAEGPKDPKAGEPKDVLITVRVRADQAARIDEVQDLESLPSRSDAVRLIIDLLTDEDLPAVDAAGGKETIPPEDVAAVMEALQARTRAYSELAKQVRAIGTQNNQLVKLGHQVVRYGKDGVIPVEAVQHFDRRIADTLDHLSMLAGDDAYVEAVVRACRP